MTLPGLLRPLPVLALFIGTTGGGGGFVDITTSGIDDASEGIGAAWDDFDGDGDQDVYVVNADFSSNVLVRALGGGAFLALPLPPLVDAGPAGAAWVDVDGDGDSDLAVRQPSGSLTLYRNDGGITFVSLGPLGDQPREAPSRGGGLAFTLLTPAWRDYDGDGDLDVYLNEFGPNRLLRNDAGTFVDVATGPVADADITTSARWVDTDRDGDADLYITTFGATNRLLRNDGGTFADVTSGPEGDTGDAVAQAWGDVDGDADFDLVLINSTQPNRLLRNDGGNAFVDVTPPVLDNAKGFSVSLVDYDLDADLDCFVVGADGAANALLRNDGGGVFADVTEASTRLGFAEDRVASWADVDADLDLDLYIVGTGANRLLRNDHATGPRVAVSLEGAGSNRDAIGAVLAAYGTGAPQVRFLAAGGGAGESARVPVFAATTQALVDSLVITWPSGVVHVYGGMEDGTHLTAREADAMPWADVTTPVTAGREGSHGVSWVDLEGDGDADVYLTSVSNPGTDSQLLRNDDGTFVDVTPPALARAGFNPGSECATWADYDNDGDPDLFRGREGDPNQLLRNDGLGGFVDVTPPVMAAEEFAEFAGWADYDRDGDLDLFAGVSGDAQLLRNDGGAFVDQTSLLAEGTSDVESALWADVDDDGDPDLLLPTSGGGDVPLLLYRNDEGTFALLSSLPRAGIPGASSIDAADIDHDGDLDLFLGGDGTASWLYRNEGGGTFVDVTPPLLAGVVEARGTAWFDADNDGDLDLVVAQGEDHPNRFFRNDGGTFVADHRGPLARTIEDAQGAAPADVDGDGDLDLLVAHRYGANALLRNDTDTGDHWLALSLRGTTSNRDGVGARIRVVAGGVSRRRDVHAGFGFRSQAPLVQHVGLGSATIVDSVIVSWPSGRRQVRTDVAVDQRLSLVEPPPAWTEVAFATSNVLAHAWGDVDADGDPDLYLCRTDEQPNQLFRNDGGGTFVEVTSGDLRVAATTNAAAWGDYDHDEDLDLLLAMSPGNRLVRNDDGVFVAVDDSDLAVPGTLTSVAWADIERDGDLDAFLGSDVSRVYRNDGGAFVDVSGELAALTGQAVGASWGDYDGDLDPDLYVAIADEDVPGALFRNDDGTFVFVHGVAAAKRREGDRGVTFGAGSSWGDVDNDGDLDLFALFAGAPNRLLRNDGNDAFVDIGAPFLQNGLGLFYGCSMADIDRDGDLDLLAGNHLYRNDGNEQFVDVASDALAAPTASFDKSPVSFVDYDSDADLDVFLSTRFEGSWFFRAAVDSDNHHVTLKLRGTLSNRSGVGARVELVAGGVRQLRSIQHTPGYNAQEPTDLAFGMGTNLLADSLIVRWPSGHVQVQAPLPAGSYLFQEPDTNPVLPGSPDVVYEPATPAGTRLLANAPNPFNPRTRIPFHVAQSALVRLDVFDVGGRAVRRLVDRRLEPGRYRVSWNGRNDAGVALPSGTYFVRLTAGEERHARQMQLLK